MPALHYFAAAEPIEKSHFEEPPSGCRSKNVTYLTDFDDSSILLRGVAFSENLPPPSGLKVHISRTNLLSVVVVVVVFVVFVVVVVVC